MQYANHINVAVKRCEDFQCFIIKERKKKKREEEREREREKRLKVSTCFTVERNTWLCLHWFVSNRPRSISSLLVLVQSVRKAGLKGRSYHWEKK